MRKVPGANLILALLAYERLWKGVESAAILNQHKSSLFPSPQPCSAGNHKK